MEYIIDPGGPQDRQALQLQTRKRRHIRNETRAEHRPEQRHAALQLSLRMCPGIEYRSSSAAYNCMGLVFACRRTWIDVAELDPILTDDEYRQLRQGECPVLGDVVVYRLSAEGDATHVGIVAQVLPLTASGQPVVKVLSQWGAHGEFVHLVDQVPDVYGRSVEYWTDRRNKP